MLGFFVRSETSKNAQAGFDSRTKVRPGTFLRSQIKNTFRCLKFVTLPGIEPGFQP